MRNYVQLLFNRQIPVYYLVAEVADLLHLRIEIIAKFSSFHAAVEAGDHLAVHHELKIHAGLCQVFQARQQLVPNAAVASVLEHPEIAAVHPRRNVDDLLHTARRPSGVGLAGAAEVHPRRGHLRAVVVVHELARDGNVPVALALVAVDVVCVAGAGVGVLLAGVERPCVGRARSASRTGGLHDLHPRAAVYRRDKG